MKNIIIGRNIAYAARIGGGTITGINQINQLDLGALAVFTETNQLLTAANVVATVADKKNVYVAVGSGSATIGASLSQMLPRFGTNYVKKAYIAPVALRKFIGNDGANGSLNLPTLVAGDEVFIKIIDTTSGFLYSGIDIDTYSDVVRTGDTGQTIITRLIAMINAHPNRIVNATIVGAGVGIQLDTIEIGTTFSISLDGILINSTVEEPEAVAPNVVGNSVTINYGEGTSAQVAAIEDNWSSYNGNTARREFAAQFYNKPTMVISGATYDQYNISYKGVRAAALTAGPQPTLLFEQIVALPAAATQQAAFETIMAEVFGNAETQETGV